MRESVLFQAAMIHEESTYLIWQDSRIQDSVARVLHRKPVHRIAKEEHRELQVGAVGGRTQVAYSVHSSTWREADALMGAPGVTRYPAKTFFS